MVVDQILLAVIGFVVLLEQHRKQEMVLEGHRLVDSMGPASVLIDRQMKLSDTNQHPT